MASFLGAGQGRLSGEGRGELDVEGPSSTTSMDKGYTGGNTEGAGYREYPAVAGAPGRHPTSRAASPSPALGVLWDLIPFRTLSRGEIKDEEPIGASWAELGERAQGQKSEQRPGSHSSNAPPKGWGKGEFS